MSKKILMDLTLLQPTCPRRGIPRVIEDIVNVIVNDAELFKKFDFVVEKRHKEYLSELIPEIKNKLVEIPNNPINKFMFTGLFCDLRMRFSQKKYSYIFLPYFNSIKFKSNIPQVTLIYDIILIRFWWQTLKNEGSLKSFLVLAYILYKHLKIKFSKKVLCISKFTQFDLENLFPGLKGKTAVIPLKVKDFPAYPIEEIPQDLHFLRDREFLLYVGGFDVRKNTIQMIETVGGYCKKHGLMFVVAGSIASKQEEAVQQCIQKCRLEDSVRLLKNVNETLLSFILDNATIFVFFSKYEGFGLPLLEAMKKRLPVVAFDNSSITEVVGGAGYLAKEGDQIDFIKGLDKLRNDPEYKMQCIESGLKVVEKYSDSNFKLKIKEKLIGYYNEFEY